MTNIRGLLIDPEKKELSFVDIPYEEGERLTGFYKAMGCELVDIVGVDQHPDGSKVIMIVDDEGLLRPNYHFGLRLSHMHGTPFSGRAILIEETPEGNLKSLDMAHENTLILSLTAVVRWFGNDRELDEIIKARGAARPATYVGSFDNKEPPTKIWEWEPHNLN